MFKCTVLSLTQVTREHELKEVLFLSDPEPEVNQDTNSDVFSLTVVYRV